MPRRLPITQAKVLGNFFMLFALLVIVAQYYCFALKTWGPIAIMTGSKYAWVVLVLFHLLISLVLWSFVQVIMTDPGQVPPFWGFHVNDSEKKRKRYCLMCNLFKPQRCHHCSVCNRCVINMDHHCPWVNNCIGFWNRKYFILLLIYVHLSCYYYAALMLPRFLETAFQFVDLYYSRNVTVSTIFSHGFMQVSYLFNILLTILMTFFLKFHLYLILTNKTTIDNLEKREIDIRPYDKGPVHNFKQVFGSNFHLWPLPLMLQAGKPDGDGVNWNQDYFDQIQSELVDPSRDEYIQRSSHNQEVSGFTLSDNRYPDTHSRRNIPPLNGGQQSLHSPENKITLHPKDHYPSDLISTKIRANQQAARTFPMNIAPGTMQIEVTHEERAGEQHPASQQIQQRFITPHIEHISVGVRSPEIESYKRSQPQESEARSTASVSQTLPYGRRSPLGRYQKSITPGLLQRERKALSSGQSASSAVSSIPLRSRTPGNLGMAKLHSIEEQQQKAFNEGRQATRSEY